MNHSTMDLCVACFFVSLFLCLFHAKTKSKLQLVAEIHRILLDPPDWGGGNLPEQDVSDAPLAELLDGCMRAVHEGLGDQNVRVYAEACMAVTATCPRNCGEEAGRPVFFNRRVLKIKHPTVFKLYN